jgi:hypothetical protein
MVRSRRRRSGAVFLTVAGLALAGAALAFASSDQIKSGRFSGTTTQTGQKNGSIDFQVTTTHTIVSGFSGDVWGSCTSGSGKAPVSLHITLDPTVNMAISRHTFGYHSNFNIKNGRVVIAKHVDGNISGKFASSSKASGTMSFAWTFDSNAPPTVVGLHCSTATADWTATNG